MHTDENKKYDKRNIERNIKNGIITQKDYEIYLSRLTDASEKLFSPEESLDDTSDFESKADDEIDFEKKGLKKKFKSKGK